MLLSALRIVLQYIVLTLTSIIYSEYMSYRKSRSVGTCHSVSASRIMHLGEDRIQSTQTQYTVTVIEVRKAPIVYGCLHHVTPPRHESAHKF